MKRVTLVFLIDAFGYDLLARYDFLPELSVRRALRTVAGFSSAAIPTLLTGRWPDEHGRWFLYSHDPVNTPFGFARFLAPLSRLPFLGRRLRPLYGELFSHFSGIGEYYHLYNIPLRLLGRFDLPGRRSIYEPGAVDGVPNVFDRLVKANIPYESWDWKTPEEENFRSFARATEAGEKPFLFLYAPRLDGVMHASGVDSGETASCIEDLDGKIRDLIARARKAYDDVSVYVCSDHGMVNVEQVIDVMAHVRELPFREGIDYLPFYDSTFARFWFFAPGVEKAIRDALSTVEGGRFLSPTELASQHVDFPGGEYGDAVFLASAGTVIAPSFMGDAPPAAMHGYHPDDAGSSGMLLSNRPVGSDINHIRRMASLLEEAALRAAGRETVEANR